MGRLDKDKRDYGIDLLRILAMVMIVLVHMLGPGGMQEAAGTYFIRHRFTWLMTATVSCAVNIYGMISGYVGVGTKSAPHISNLLHLWFQVVAYTVGCLIASSFLWPEAVAVTKEGIIHALHPVTGRAYWYFTAYFALFFLMPSLNHIVNTLPKKDLITLVCACVILFSILPTVCAWDLFQVNSGYSVLWLAVLYLIGGTLRRFELPKKGNFWIVGGTMLVLIAACIALNYFNWVVFLHLGKFDESYALFKYTAPTNLAIPIALLIIFAGKHMPRILKPVIGFFSPLTFGVYLLHVNPHLYGHLFNGQFARLVELPPKKQLLTTAAITVVFFLACIFIEAIRAALFKLLHVKDFCRWVEKKITGLFFASKAKAETP